MRVLSFSKTYRIDVNRRKISKSKFENFVQFKKKIKILNNLIIIILMRINEKGVKLEVKCVDTWQKESETIILRGDH